MFWFVTNVAAGYVRIKASKYSSLIDIDAGDTSTEAHRSENYYFPMQSRLRAVERHISISPGFLEMGAVRK